MACHITFSHVWCILSLHTLHPCSHPETAMTHVYLTVLIFCLSLAGLTHHTCTVVCIRISSIHK